MQSFVASTEVFLLVRYQQEPVTLTIKSFSQDSTTLHKNISTQHQHERFEDFKRSTVY